MQQSDLDRVLALGRRLFAIAKPMRVLSHLAWPQQVKDDFFAAGARELPVVSYPEYDAAPLLRELADLSSSLQATPLDAWLGRQIKAIQTTASMLQHCAQREFYTHSKALYGSPDMPLLDGSTTSLGLAKRFDDVLDSVSGIDLGEPPPACYLADYVAAQIRQRIDPFFGEAAPEVYVVEELSANALAGAKRIRLRQGACFTDRDITQLIEHEAFVHVATSLNGRAQTELPMLSISHAGTTRTQEGLAVFAEFISGNMDLDRLRRLSDRVIAIQMAVEGADFLQVYDYFCGRVESEDQAFESTRRVFRGGVLSGGAPFTKDIVYLDGLLRVHNFLRAAVVAGRADCLSLLFCGKLDLDDIPVLAELRQHGLCAAPRFLPSWADDRRFLLSYLAYSSFLNQVEMDKVNQYYAALLATLPSI